MKDEQKAIVIITSICEYFNQKYDDVIGKKRNREIIEARHFSMYYLKKYTRLPLAAIGEIVGNKDHTTVIHAINSVDNLINFNGYKAKSKYIEWRLGIAITGTVQYLKAKRLRYHYRAMFKKARLNRMVIN